MKTRGPRVSIGLPVYNGDRFLKDALDSILAQTFDDFELIISDNASTDNTQEICRAYVAQDPRVRYRRNAQNLGASWNFNRVFALSIGEYFKWAAHDDICAPSFLSRCVEVLDEDPGVVLCYTREIDIDEKGNIRGRRPYRLDTSLVRPDERFGAILRIDRGSPPIFGVMRRDILSRTPLIGNYFAADQVLLAELALYGRFHEVTADLLLHREHLLRSVYVHTRHSAAMWWDPARAGRILFPTWRILIEYFLTTMRAPLSWSERIRCSPHIARWLRWRLREAIDDVTYVAKQASHARFSRVRPWSSDATIPLNGRRRGARP